MKKIRVITCYFGKLPDWMPLWLLSCERNPKIDFLVVTDQNYCDRVPRNVEFLNINFEQLKDRFQKNVDVKISLNRSYKLCDYRPLYGKTFSSELQGYDFWGHCDLDMILGNLEQYLTDEILGKYDRIGKFGAFTLYRNIDSINELYKCKGALFNWREVFTNPENYIFDEMPGMNMICKKNNIAWYKELPIIDLSPNMSRMGLRVSREEIFVWELGRVKHYYLENNCLKSNEAAYIHFSGKYPVNTISNNVIPERIVISSKKFSTYEKKITEKEVKELTEYIGPSDDKAQVIKIKKKKIADFMRQNTKEKIIRIKTLICVYFFMH